MPQNKRSYSERLFCISVYVLDDRRRGIIPKNVEKQILLYANAHGWGIDSVNAAVND